MKSTKKESESKNESQAKSNEGQARSLVSAPTSIPATQPESGGLSRDLAGSLMGLIRDVNKDGVTPETVNASCNAANAIYKILRLNFEMKKEGM